MIHDQADRQPRGVAAGLVAGIIGIGCCIGPAIAALTGIISAAVAIDAANTLYSEWGWLFKLAGFIAAALAIGLSARARRRCRSRPLGIARYALIVGVTGFVTYAGLYGLTTWLGNLAANPGAAAFNGGSSGVKEFLLPDTDSGVALQVVATAVVAPIAVMLVGRKQRDVAWLVGGITALWIAFMAYRALH